MRRINRTGAHPPIRRAVSESICSADRACAFCTASRWKAPLGIASCLVIRDVRWEQRVTRHVQDARKMGEMEMRNIDNFGHSLPKDASDIAPNAGAFDAIIIRSLTIKSIDDGLKKKRRKREE